MANTLPVDLLQVSVRLPRAIAKAAKRMASQRGLTVAEYYAEALRAQLVVDAPELRTNLLEEQARLAQAQQENKALLALVGQ